MNAHVETPHDRGCFCHNKECVLSRLQGFPDDFPGPITVDRGLGEEQIARVLGVAKQNEGITFWLCEPCHNSAMIACGRADPTELPVDLEAESQIIRPN